MESVTIEVMPDKRLSKNRLRSTHWATLSKLSRKAREDAFILSLASKPDGWTTPDQATVEVTQYHARKPLDFEGLACQAAAYLDGMVDAGILLDDSPGVIVNYKMQHQKVSTVAESRVTIRVTPLEALQLRSDSNGRSSL
jgi:hypothetical protein